MQSLVVLLASLGCLTGGLALQIQQLDVPRFVEPGHQVTLSCYYDLEGSDLYSVKWYHYGMEFFRFTPSSSPSVKTFNGARGINVNVAASDQYRVVLSDISVASDGEYTCEVSGEAPRFESSRATASMRVFDPDQKRSMVSSAAKPMTSAGGLGLLLMSLMYW